MVPSKLKRYFYAKHSNLTSKYKNYFKRVLARETRYTLLENGNSFRQAQNSETDLITTKP